MDPVVRPYARLDREAVLALSLRAWEPVFASLRDVLGPSGVFDVLHPDWRASQSRAVDAMLSAADVRVWVAERDGAVVGFVAAQLHRDEDVGEVTMLAVDPDAQRRGVGAALTDRALRWITEQGMRAAMVETGGDPGHAPARRTYERAGFTPLPVVRYFTTLPAR